MTARRSLMAVSALICLGAASSCATAAETSAAPQSSEEAIVLETGTGRLHGTLALPGGPGPVPVALIIAGSGPTNRDGNILGAPGQNNSLRMLAEALADRGIASLRYDKRGIGESAPAATAERDLRFETYIADAGQWIEKLRADERFGSVIVIGHSEGSLIGMVAARQAVADAFVSIAGAGRPAADILRDQLQRALPSGLYGRSEEILQSIERGDTVADVPAELAALFRPSVQPYLISWFPYAPADEIGKLEVPVLVVQGTTDVQVGEEEARALAGGSSGSRLVVIDGMNHVLKQVSGGVADQQSSYFDPALPIVPELVEAVAGFIRERSGGEGGAGR